MLYSINEIFYSIQGEGRNTGMPAWFIRFAGCNLNCPWCDTDYLERITLTEHEIVGIISTNLCKSVVITGGEPTIQDLRPLLRLLKAESFYAALETNGMNNVLKYRIEGLLDWVTVSPKNGKVAIGCKIEEIKLVWPSSVRLTYCEEILADYYYLQPLEPRDAMKSRRRLMEKRSNLKKTIETVLKNPKKWRLSLQTQKIINVK